MSHFNMPSEPIIHGEEIKSPLGTLVIEGAQIIHALCPVNKHTHLAQDIGSAIRMALNDPKLFNLVDAVVQELPAISSDPRLTDSDRLDFVVNRFDVGTPGETDKVRAALMDLTDVLFPKSNVPEQVVEQVETPAVEVDTPAE